MANTNVLEGMACPKCGSEGPFNILITALATVYDDGTDEQFDTEWDEDSRCDCIACGYSGKVWNFEVSE